MQNSQRSNRELLTPDEFREKLETSETVLSMSLWLSRQTLLITVDGLYMIKETELRQGSGTMTSTLALFDEAQNVDQIHWRNVSIGYSGESRTPGRVIEPSVTDEHRFGSALKMLLDESRS